jgi:uncharacterized protein (TIGR02996 family)
MNESLDYNFTFLLELLATPAELGFVLTLHEDPKDPAARAAYHDWLLEQGRVKSAQVVLEGYTPGLLSRPGPYSTGVVGAGPPPLPASAEVALAERERLLALQREEMERFSNYQRPVPPLQSPPHPGRPGGPPRGPRSG